MDNQKIKQVKTKIMTELLNLNTTEAKCVLSHVSQAIQQIAPGKELYNKVKVGFIIKGTTLGAWCRRSGVKQQNVMSCLIGTWDGPKAKMLRAKVIQESGIVGGNDENS
ncbi:hypothetical protein [Vibrio vulnificus]|uniref:hypothetical protein n=1 Tax=Vibrio vulnificus TaxID=672 RepID=UPI003EDA3BBE